MVLFWVSVLGEHTGMSSSGMIGTMGNKRCVQGDSQKKSTALWDSFKSSICQTQRNELKAVRSTEGRLQWQQNRKTIQLRLWSIKRRKVSWRADEQNMFCASFHFSTEKQGRFMDACQVFSLWWNAPRNTFNTGLMKTLLVFFILQFGLCLSFVHVSSITFCLVVMGLVFCSSPWEIRSTLIELYINCNNQKLIVKPKWNISV